MNDTRAFEARIDEASVARDLLRSIDQGFCVVEVLFDDADRPLDYVFLTVNAEFGAKTGLIDAVGKRMRSLRPDHEAFWFETYGRIALSGRAETFEQRAAALGRWYRVHAFRTGAPERRTVAILFEDISERRRTEAALRESEIRFQEFGDNSGNALWIVDAATQRLEYLSPAFERIWGEPRERVMADIGRWAALVHPEDSARALQGMPRLLAGERFDSEYRIVRPDGAIRWIHDSGFPIFDEEGRVSRVAGIAQDFTEQRKAVEAVRESELRFRTLSEGIPQLVWRAVDHGVWTWASPQWTAFTGQSDAESHGWGWLSPVHPDDREAARAAWERAKETGAFEVEYRVRHAATGDYRWFTARASPVLDEHGAIIEWLGTSTDIDELRGLQRHQATLLAELQHRVRNTLGVLRSIARRTAANSDSVDEMAAHLQGRIGAFSRVQSTITREPGSGVLLAGLVAEELVAHAIDEGERLSIKGPRFCLATRPAESISLMVHELTTNAVKYGALSGERGRIAVSWNEEQRSDARWLRFRWVERGLDGLLEPPSRRGFGLELFERSLTYDLGAAVQVRFPPEGLEFEMAVPAERVEAA